MNSKYDKFSFLCVSNPLREVVEYYNRWKNAIDIHAFHSHVFILTCKYGRLDVAKWLWMISEGTIDIHTDNECAFRWCCRNGYLDVAKWLWKISKETINSEYAFRCSCENYHLDIAKWLWRISDKKIDIHLHNHRIFKSICYKNHIGVAKWLCDLYLDERYIIRNTIDNKLFMKLHNRNVRIINELNNVNIKNDMLDRTKWLRETYGADELCKIFGNNYMFAVKE